MAGDSSFRELKPSELTVQASCSSEGEDQGQELNVPAGRGSSAVGNQLAET